MATKFLEPGGDATFDFTFWDSVTNVPSIVTDFVHGTHIKSIKYRPNQNDQVQKNSVLADAGGRLSFYMYMNAKPSVGTTQIMFNTGASGGVFRLKLKTSGAIILTENSNQIGADGPTLNTGQWYRICLAWTITSSTVNQFRVFVDGVQQITGSNVTLAHTGGNQMNLGNLEADTALDLRMSDIYIDDSTSLSDPGDVWVTAKRPFSNGTTNGFTTQIGSGGSGYGSGHAPQVNERALSTTNGWSMIGAGSAVTEEYSIEGPTAGDISMDGATIVDFMGWVYAKSVANETAQIIVAGSNSNISLTNANLLFTKAAGSTTYPAGNTDIGIITSTTLTTVSLYECGIIVAFIPVAPTVTTSAATSITQTDAVGNGNVTKDGGSAITERGIVWSTNPNPTTSDNKATAAGTTGAYTASMTGLSPGTTYHDRAYAINAEGTSYGADDQFNTSSSGHSLGLTGVGR